jgi:hypothetical protein
MGYPGLSDTNAKRDLPSKEGNKIKEKKWTQK